MSKPSTKLWLCFLSNVLAVFDRFNTFFQSSSVSTAHKSYGEIIHLLNTVLGFLIKPQVIIQHSDDGFFTHTHTNTHTHTHTFLYLLFLRGHKIVLVASLIPSHLNEVTTVTVTSLTSRNQHYHLMPITSCSPSPSSSLPSTLSLSHSLSLIGI